MLILSEPFLFVLIPACVDVALCFNVCNQLSPVCIIELKSFNSHLKKFSVVHSDRLKHAYLNRGSLAFSKFKWTCTNPFSVQGMGLCLQRHGNLGGEVLVWVLYVCHSGRVTPVFFSNEGEDKVWTVERSETISQVKKLKGGTKGVESPNLDK